VQEHAQDLKPFKVSQRDDSLADLMPGNMQAAGCASAGEPCQKESHPPARGPAFADPLVGEVLVQIGEF
jgi:hypothetical protein